VVLVLGRDVRPAHRCLAHAGTHWEIDFAETQQILMLNGVRDFVIVQVDDKMETGHEVITVVLLSAEEYSLAMAPLLVSSCIMMCVWHLHNCIVGVATGPGATWPPHLQSGNRRQ